MRKNIKHSAKRFARNLFVPYHHKHLQDNNEDVNPPCDALQVCHYFTFFLPIRNVKHQRGFISSSLQDYIIYSGVPLRPSLKTVYRKTSWTPFTALQYHVELSQTDEIGKAYSIRISFILFVVACNHCKS